MQLKALVPRNVVSKNEVNPFSNKKVMSEVKVFCDGLTDVCSYERHIYGVIREYI